MESTKVVKNIFAKFPKSLPTFNGMFRKINVLISLSATSAIFLAQNRCRHIKRLHRSRDIRRFKRLPLNGTIEAYSDYDTIYNIHFMYKKVHTKSGWKLDVLILFSEQSLGLLKNLSDFFLFDNSLAFDHHLGWWLA